MLLLDIHNSLTSLAFLEAFPQETLSLTELSTQLEAGSDWIYYLKLPDKVGLSDLHESSWEM